MAEIEHASITDPDIHETKGAASAGANTVLVANGDGTTSFSEGAMRQAAFDTSNPLKAHDTPTYDSDTGLWVPVRHVAWNYRADSVYTSSAKRAIASGVRTKVTIDGLTVSAGDPSGVTLWNTSTNKVVPEGVDDTYTIRFQCKSSASGTGVYFDLEYDIGGSLGVIDARSISLVKGGSTTNNISATSSFFVGSTFFANGMDLYITPSANADFWDFTILVQKTFGGTV